MIDARLSVNVPSQGTYFLEVRSTGQGDPATTGYSSYGSTGSFRVSANYPVASGSAPSAPTWYMVDIRLVQVFPEPLTRAAFRPFGEVIEMAVAWSAFKQ